MYSLSALYALKSLGTKSAKGTGEGKVFQYWKGDILRFPKIISHANWCSLSFLHLLFHITYQQGGSISLACNPILLKAELHKLHFRRRGNKIQLFKSPLPPTPSIWRSRMAIICIKTIKTRNLLVGASTVQSVAINSLDTISQWCFKANIIVLKAWLF